MPYQRARTPIGHRRERATIYAAATVDDGMGGQAASAPAAGAKIGGIWVEPVPLDDRRLEAVMAGQVTAARTYHFDTRYRTDIRPSMELEWRGRRLQIQTVADDDARKRRLVIFCTEVETSGS